MTAARRIHRRGALLLEVLVSLTIFIFVGLAAINLTSQALSSVQRAADTRRATDLARSVMSRIEIGMVAPEAAGGPVVDQGPDALAEGTRAAAGSGWSVRVETRAGPLADLTLVTVHVLRQAAPRAGEPVTVYSLRELVRLGEVRAAAAAGATP